MWLCHVQPQLCSYRDLPAVVRLQPTHCWQQGACLQSGAVMIGASIKESS